MKHFGIYRKLILIIGTATAVVSVGVFFFMEDILFRTLFISFAFVFLCGLLFLMDFLHNGDGIGDLRGVAEKLDYLKDLGVDYLWLTPFFVSPQRDNGYDVADYRNIDPMFGTMEDLDNLIAEGEKRNIGLMFDMVFNHTSTSHEWFRRALAGEKNIRIIIYLRRGRRISPRQTGSQSLEVLHGNMYPLSENGICIYLM
ncbi:alpha-amylase family glycosyl hydrolase [[Ruminococcus] torques]|uniref:alpha-amylase family glycosyl hydrolase n=1 Tax=[Ruminococcus] torques TaxID=33039 RepID=UPI00210DEE1A|nr:alpha-amylase family glycosyl hydrolase [[Ruminococcus] torques]MCQ5344762.1 alpha-amylase family glycosyl hydrolase [[Ruminococcus] torques]MCQ5354171.1 alpha-amylase family glycosyl hydrolase [[Ruminococcus] torques]MCQ5360328.1 alpha-amylase family glycosyl hydrolase [[Ruminococcus] torques]